MGKSQNALRFPSGAGASHEVGYGRPPTHTRFQPGRSGNPRGRPKGSRNRVPGLHEERLKTIIMEESYRPITVMDGNRPVTVPVAQAFVRSAVRSLSVKALKGDARAQRLYAELLTATERSNRELYDDHLKKAVAYKAGATKELARRRRAGIIAEDMVPHPDDIVINVAAGTVELMGLMTREQKKAWDELARRRDEWAARIRHFETELETETDPEERADLKVGIHTFRECLDKIVAEIGTWPYNRGGRQNLA